MSPRYRSLLSAIAGSISNAADDHHPTPAVSCTSIKAHCETLGAGGSTANSLVMEDAGKPNANAKIGNCRNSVLDRFIPWIMVPPEYCAVADAG